MKKFIFLFLIVILLFFGIINDIAAKKQSKFIKIDDKTKIEYYVLDSNKTGPTIFILGGIHGNEPAGYQAAYELTKYNLNKGKIIIFPAVNNFGINSNDRYYYNNIDLNRCFPGEKQRNEGEKLAFVLFKFIKKIKADMVLDLHESEQYLIENNKFSGQSIIAGKTDQSILYAMNVINQINKNIYNDKHKFFLDSFPVKNSLVWAADKNLHIPAFIIETCKKINIKKRINYQIKIITYLLKEAGVELYE